MDKIGVLILAAGYSSRMGAFKALLGYKHHTLIEELVTTYKNAGVEPIVIVTGYKKALLDKQFKDDFDVQLAYNPCFDHGMYSSILAGLDLLKDVQAFFVNPVDCPFIKSKTIHELISAFDKNDRTIVYPNFNKRRGHPPLIASKYRAYLKAYSGDGGLRGALKIFNKDACDYEVRDLSILDDLDDQAAYDKILLRRAPKTP